MSTFDSIIIVIVFIELYCITQIVKSTVHVSSETTTKALDISYPPKPLGVTLRRFTFQTDSLGSFSGKLRYGPPIIQSKSNGGWSISEHLSIR